LGGNDVAFLQYYADMALRMVQHPRNRSVWQKVGANAGDNVLFEQYLLAACLDYHSVEARCLFDSIEQAFDGETAAKLGYTHLIGGAKKNQQLARSLETRVAREYPAAYERCCELTAERPLVALASRGAFPPRRLSPFALYHKRAPVVWRLPTLGVPRSDLSRPERGCRGLVPG